MSNIVKQGAEDIVSNIVLKGDISGLSPDQKVSYYKSVCEKLGIDPSTQPFQLLNLSGKQVLYCSKAGGEQLTAKYKISHDIRERATVSDVFVVYVRAIDPDGRFEDSSGAVSITGLKGDALANAMMKAETKAKRRSTLSLLGLGTLDETEIETIPNAIAIPINGNVEATQTPEPKKNGSFDPATEEANSKKYPDKKWAELPSDYLQWVVKNSKSADARKKAAATLKWLEMQESIAPQEPNVTDEMFGHESSESPFDELASTLNEAAHEYTEAALAAWMKRSEAKIKALKTQEKDVLRKAYVSALADAKKAAKSEVGI